MHVTPLQNSCAHGEPGIFKGELTFSSTVLADYRWPLCEIRGRRPGPRLCISAGVHVNEVSSMEAAVRLQKLFDPDTIRGSVSIIPLINQPAHYRYSEYVCPIDGRNINFTFPGKPEGTFSEVLCHAIMNEWCEGSDCYVDMHGGDLRENVSKFAIYQRTANQEIDRLGRQMASCFDAEIVVGLPPVHMEKPGRPPTGFARHDRLALMSEAGANGILDEESITFHVDGVLNIGRTLGILDGPVSSYSRRRVQCNEYLWVQTPVDGEFHAEIEPGAPVTKGQRLGTMRNLFGDVLASIEAPATGLVLWRMTHPSLTRGTAVLAVAVKEAAGSAGP